MRHEEAAPRRGRVSRLALFGVTVSLLLCASVSTVAAWGIITGDPRAGLGKDLAIMRELGSRWIETGTMYLPYQLTGPYSIDVTPDLADTPALYPPAAGPVFAVLSVIPGPLAAVLWWAVPFAILAYAIHRWRPGPWAWVGMLAMCVHPMTTAQVFVGGTSMWVVALIAAGLLWHWPAALILIKPTLLPFALVGARHRSWWVVAVAIGFVTLAGPWRDYVTVAMNAADSGGGIAYSLAAFPMMLIPIIAASGTISRPRGITIGGQVRAPLIPRL